MQECKCKLDYALSPYTKTGIHTSMLKCYSTAPFGFFTEKKRTKKDINFHYCTCSTYSNVQHMREVKTCSFQYQFLQFYQHKAAPHWKCSKVLPCTSKALMVSSTGLSLCGGSTTAPKLPTPSVPTGSAAGPQTTPSQTICNSSG